MAPKSKTRRGRTSKSASSATWHDARKRKASDQSYESEPDHAEDWNDAGADWDEHDHSNDAGADWNEHDHSGDVGADWNAQVHSDEVGADWNEHDHSDEVGADWDEHDHSDGYRDYWCDKGSVGSEYDHKSKPLTKDDLLDARRMFFHFKEDNELTALNAVRLPFSDSLMGYFKMQMQQLISNMKEDQLHEDGFEVAQKRMVQGLLTFCSGLGTHADIVKTIVDRGDSDGGSCTLPFVPTERNPSLNDCQQRAVDRAMLRRVSLVQGPPGLDSGMQYTNPVFAHDLLIKWS